MSINSSKDAVGQYQSVNVYGEVEGADQRQLVLLMMQGVVERISVARGHMERGEAAPKGEQISKVINIIDTLRGCLNPEGGELSENLESLYDYMVRTLVTANASDDPEGLQEVSALMNEIKSGWEGMMASPEVSRS